MIIEKIEYCILNGLGYIGHLEKKSGNKLLAKMANQTRFESTSLRRTYCTPHYGTSCTSPISSIFHQNCCLVVEWE